MIRTICWRASSDFKKLTKHEARPFRGKLPAEPDFATGPTTFLEDGRVEVDSNVVERSMKSVALTRKNSLFVGSAHGGKTFAVIASLVNTCKLNGVDPEIWLADVLECVISGEVKANEIDGLLPWNWKASREAMAPQKRQAA